MPPYINSWSQKRGAEATGLPEAKGQGDQVPQHSGPAVFQNKDLAQAFRWPVRCPADVVQDSWTCRLRAELVREVDLSSTSLCDDFLSMHSSKVMTKWSSVTVSLPMTSGQTHEDTQTEGERTAVPTRQTFLSLPPLVKPTLISTSSLMGWALIMFPHQRRKHKSLQLSSIKGRRTVSMFGDMVGRAQGERTNIYSLPRMGQVCVRDFPCVTACRSCSNKGANLVQSHTVGLEKFPTPRDLLLK